MFPKLRTARSHLLLLKSCLIFVYLMAWQQNSFGDEAKSPSAEEKKAVATLSEKGAVIFIDGEYQVTQILGGRDLTNAELQQLRVFKKLKVLSLSYAKIDDKSVETLKPLTQLQSLNLPAGVISEKALQELKTALPNCRIVMPDRRAFGKGVPPGPGTSGADGSAERLDGWSSFEFPPIVPAPSISFEIHSPAVQEHLKLSAEQKKEIERVTGREFQRQQTEDAIKKVLSAKQKVRMQQVLLQREGPTALVLPEVAQDLKLTNEQRAAIQSIMDDRRKQLLAVGDQLRDRTLDFSQASQETNRVLGKANERLLSTLTDQQRQAWDAKIGPPIPTFTWSGSSKSQTPEENARSHFRNLDRNSDHQLTAEEWQRSRNTRIQFEQHNITLQFPVKVEEFVKKYVEMDEAVKKSRK